MNLFQNLIWRVNSFVGTLSWTPTSNVTITLPPRSGTVTLDNDITNSGQSRSFPPIIVASASKTLALADSGTLQSCRPGSAITITIPPESTVNFAVGAEIRFSRGTNGAVTIQSGAGVALLDAVGGSSTNFSVQTWVQIRKIATNSWQLEPPIASSVNLPGSPSTSTQAIGTSDTTIATTAFASNQINNLSKRRYLFVIAGESNAGGFNNPNTLLTPDQLLPTPHAQIWHNTSNAFQPMQIGTNNLIGHNGISDNAHHGIERGLARDILQVLQWPEAYILKAGQGGSRISQWAVGDASGYLATLTTRFNAARAAMVARGFTVIPVLIWFNGVNDAIAATNTTTWRTATQAHFTQIRTLMGTNTAIFFPKVMAVDAAHNAINAEIQAIANADPLAWSLETQNIPPISNDPSHYTANGYLRIARAFTDGFRTTVNIDGTFSLGQDRASASNPAIVLKRSLNLTIPSQVATTIPFDIVSVDTDNLANVSGGLASTVTIHSGSEGVYQVCAMVTMDPAQLVSVQLYINGVQLAQGPVTLNPTDIAYSDEFTRVMRLNAGDIIETKCYQQNTANVSKNLLVTPLYQATLSLNRISR